jgi:cytochrome b561
MGNSDLAILIGLGVVLLVIVRLLWRGNRRSSRTEVGPVSEQWLAERRGKQD